MSKAKQMILMMLEQYGVRGDWSSVDEAPLLHLLISEMAVTDFETNGPTAFNQTILDRANDIMDDGEVGNG